MPPRAPGTGAVPEVDRERAVRKIEVKDSAGREHADEACQESGALRVPGGKWRNLVEAGSAALGHADMLAHSRRDYGVEEAVEEGKAQRVRDDEPLAVRSGPPLPLAKCREVVSPRFEARLREEVDRLAVPAARVEDAPRARRAQDRQVVILDAAPRVFVLESATSLLGQGLGVGVVRSTAPRRSPRYRRRLGTSCRTPRRPARTATARARRGMPGTPGWERPRRTPFPFAEVSPRSLPRESRAVERPPGPSATVSPWRTRLSSKSRSSACGDGSRS